MNPSSRAHGGGGQYPTIALPGRYHTRRTASALYGDVTWNSSPTLRFPSPSTSKKERSAFPDPFVSGWMNANNLVAFAYVALYSDRGRTRETAETTTRVPPVVFKTNAICGSVGRFSCTSPRGMNTIASIPRRMRPDRKRVVARAARRRAGPPAPGRGGADPRGAGFAGAGGAGAGGEHGGVAIGGFIRGPEVGCFPPAGPGEPRDRPPHPRGGGVQD